MALIPNVPIQPSEVITRVLPENRTDLAPGDKAIINLPASILLFSAEAVTAPEYEIVPESTFSPKQDTVPLTGEYAVLFLGADAFGNKVTIENISAAEDFTLAVIQ